MKYAPRGTKDQNQNLVECARPLLVADAVPRLPEKMITISAVQSDLAARANYMRYL